MTSIPNRIDILPVFFYI